MLSCKSSPLIDESDSTRNRPKRDSRNHCVSGMPGMPYPKLQYKIPNPFRIGEEENILPTDIRRQIEQIDYISPSQLKSIHYSHSQRRSSLFGKHLLAMQSAARKQEEKYNSILNPKKKVRIYEEQPSEEQPMTIQENQDVSLGAKHFLEMDNEIEEEQFNFLNCYDEGQVVYYSQHEIPDVTMRDDYETYFNN